MKSVMLRVSFFLLAFFMPVIAFAAEAGGADSYMKIGLALGAGLGLGFAVIGGALGQGKAVAAALEGIGRNPGSADKIFLPMIIGLALIESLVIYALLIAFMLVGKI